MTLFFADGKLTNVAKANCRNCYGTGWTMRVEHDSKTHSIKYIVEVCNCIEVKIGSEDSQGGKTWRMKH